MTSSDDHAMLLAENADLLLAHAADIAREPRFFHCPFGALSLAYVGHPECCLGALVGLWVEGKLTVRCPRCGGTVLIFGMGGSPLSGTHGWTGTCKDCKAKICRSDLSEQDRPDFGALFEPLRRALKARANTAIVKRGVRPRFSWGKGLVGKSTPDVVIRAAVEPVPFAQIVDILRGGGDLNFPGIGLPEDLEGGAS